jgi:DNA-binding response OmpR family regulator
MLKRKILIVDDDADLRLALGLRLRANHYDVAFAPDGFSALKSAQTQRPDAIILDLGLPSGNGFLVLDSLQRNVALSSIPVIVLTARDPEFTREHALTAGASAFLQKPADNADLMLALREVLNLA